MIGPLLLCLTCLLLVGAAVRLFYSGLRKSGSERVLERLGQAQADRPEEKPLLSWVEKAFLRAGMGRPTHQLGRWLMLWSVLMLIGLVAAGWPGLLVMLVSGPLALRLFVSWRYRRRLKKMISQLPGLLDHAVRSLKAGRTLTDAVLGAIDASADPLAESMRRVQRNVQLGVSLADAMHDLAELYEQDELRLFALGLRINHRYGGNASELLENLIKVIREREQAARQLAAMTGETRMTAYVLALLPIAMVGYFLATNPNYLLGMWDDTSGQHMLLGAFILQVLGCVALWRMLRSI
ncbi:type II secretion system F family protein [Pseudomonas sp. R5(2019)]|uniref:type II secretion system F family protein n=1 Tax=Pseudomonas sp. R5(2019) TaxID=2697566 RepID=UPI001412591B|nr:type II secretion system F family protein [Pseudomonas sp. R5(2019)]NBA95075.1 type II secretion system protein F [Pseudomonas sp. R5(2019)]